MRLMTQNSWLIQERLEKILLKKQIAMDFPHTLTVMVAIADAPFRCFG